MTGLPQTGLPQRHAVSLRETRRLVGVLFFCCVGLLVALATALAAKVLWLELIS